MPDKQYQGNLKIENPKNGVKLTVRNSGERLGEYMEDICFYEYEGRSDVGYNSYRTDPVDIAAVLTGHSPAEIRKAISK